jgi:hypothetical protein
VLQLRLGLEGVAVAPEVWAALGEESRAQVIERLAQVMVNAIVAAIGQGGEQSDEGDEECEECERETLADPGEGHTRIA